MALSIRIEASFIQFCLLIVAKQTLSLLQGKHYFSGDFPTLAIVLRNLLLTKSYLCRFWPSFLSIATSNLARTALFWVITSTNVLNQAFSIESKNFSHWSKYEDTCVHIRSEEIFAKTISFINFCAKEHQRSSLKITLILPATSHMKIFIIKDSFATKQIFEEMHFVLM